MPFDAFHGVANVVVLYSIDLAQGIFRVVGLVVDIRQGCHCLGAQVLPLGTEQLHTDGIPLYLVVHFHKSAENALECDGRVFSAGGKGCHHITGVQAQRFKGLCGGFTSVNGTDGELLNGVAHLVQVPCTGIRALLEDVEHVVRREAQLRKLHGILADGVNELAGIVKSILCTGRDQPHGLLTGNAEVGHHGLRRPGAFRDLIAEGVGQCICALGRFRQLIAGQLRGLVDLGNAGSGIFHAFAEIAAVHIFQHVRHALQLLANHAGAGCYVIDCGIEFIAKSSQVYAGFSHRDSRTHSNGANGGTHRQGTYIDAFEFLLQFLYGLA